MNKTKVVAACLLMSMALVMAASADDNAITNSQLSGILVNMIGITLPAGTGNLPAGEAFEVMANALAVRGINNFVDQDPSGAVTYGQLASLLYTLIGGTDPLDDEGKITYLVSQGVLTPQSPNSVVWVNDATNILSNPTFVGLIAEAYQPPTEVRSVGGASVTPESSPENIVSPI